MYGVSPKLWCVILIGESTKKMGHVYASVDTSPPQTEIEPGNWNMTVYISLCIIIMLSSKVLYNMLGSTALHNNSTAPLCTI